MKKIINIFIIITFLFTPFFYMQAEGGSGFLSDTIWYSKKDFTEGDTVEIHTAIWNAENTTLTAKVEFTDLGTILGSRSISVEAHSLEDVFITWKVTAGDHTIKATIKDASVIASGVATPVAFIEKEQSLPKIFISKKLNNKIPDVNVKSITDKVESTLPENVAKPIAKSITSVDDFRVNTAGSVSVLLDNTNKKIKELSTPQPKPTDQKKEVAQKPLSGTEKPIAYVELFLLTVVSFIFKNAIVFYLVFAFVLFIILRFVYRKIRGR